MPTTNQRFFYENARPGLIGLIGVAGATRLLPTAIRILGGEVFNLVDNQMKPRASHWSHSFLVESVETTAQGKRVHIIESTLIQKRELSAGYQNNPGDPRWDGVQRSVLVEKHKNKLRGHRERRPIRRYVNKHHTPNVTLLDFGLTPALLNQVLSRADALIQLTPQRYATLELLGTLVAVDRGELDKVNPLNSSNMFCNAFIAQCFAHVPAFQALAQTVHESNLMPEHLFQLAASEAAQGNAAVFEPRPPKDLPVPQEALIDWMLGKMVGALSGDARCGVAR